jgi:hypothetical protein
MMRAMTPVDFINHLRDEMRNDKKQEYGAYADYDNGPKPEHIDQAVTEFGKQLGIISPDGEIIKDPNVRVLLLSDGHSEGQDQKVALLAKQHMAEEGIPFFRDTVCIGFTCERAVRMEGMRGESYFVSDVVRSPQGVALKTPIQIPRPQHYNEQITIPLTEEDQYGNKMPIVTLSNEDMRMLTAQVAVAVPPKKPIEPVKPSPLDEIKDMGRALDLLEKLLPHKAPKDGPGQSPGHKEQPLPGALPLTAQRQSNKGSYVG